MQKSPDMINAFLGVVRSGCYYVPIDEEMPPHRIDLIFERLKPELVICDDTTEHAAAELQKSSEISFQIVKYNMLINYEVNEGALAEIENRAIDTDPIYIVFTSGSTGIPKGVLACHRLYRKSFGNFTGIGKYRIWKSGAAICRCLPERNIPDTQIRCFNTSDSKTAFHVSG